MVYDIAIVDDDAGYVDEIVKYLHRFQEEETMCFRIHTFYSGVDFMTDYRPGFDIILMDIEMQGCDGIETAKELRMFDDYVCLIFITNMAKYAIKGYEVSAMDFMVKPIPFFNFSLMLKRAIQYVNSKKNEKIIINSRCNSISPFVHDISYIETDKHYLLYHIGGEVYKERGLISEKEKLLFDFGFLRSHKFCLVNLKHVILFSNNEVTVLDGGTRVNLPISRSRKKQFLDALTAYVK